MKTLFSESDFPAWLLEKGKSSRVLVMGILNVTPDSFSDGGRFESAQDATACGLEMLEHGADIIDVGGESTRPGSTGVDPDEQIRRVVPVIESIQRQTPGCVISIDTTSAQVAQRACEAGASLINDTSGGTDDPQMLSLVAKLGVPIVLMHRLAPPSTMQVAPKYDDVTRDVKQRLVAIRDAAITAGILPHHILLDVGIGFGKTTAHNLKLLKDHAEFKELGHRLLVGASRKRFIGEVTKAMDPRQVNDATSRLPGSIAAALREADHGADILRVHDVRETVEALMLLSAITAAD